MLNNQGRFHAIRVLKLVSMWRNYLLDNRVLSTSDFGQKPKSPIEIKIAVNRLIIDHGDKDLTLETSRTYGEKIFIELKEMGSINLEKKELSKAVEFLDEARKIYYEVANVKKGKKYFELFLRYFDSLETTLSRVINLDSNNLKTKKETDDIDGVSFQIPKDKVIPMSSSLSLLKSFSQEKFFSTNLDYDVVAIKIPSAEDGNDFTFNYALINKENVFFTKNSAIINVPFNQGEREKLGENKVYPVLAVYESSDGFIPIKKVGLLSKKELMKDVIEKYNPSSPRKDGKMVNIENVYKAALDFYYSQSTSANPLNLFVEVGKLSFHDFSLIIDSKIMPLKFLADPTFAPSVFSGRSLYMSTKKDKMKIRDKEK